jgi:hypothetical protein
MSILMGSEDSLSYTTRRNAIRAHCPRIGPPLEFRAAHQRLAKHR